MGADSYVYCSFSACSVTTPELPPPAGSDKPRDFGVDAAPTGSDVQASEPVFVSGERVIIGEGIACLAPPGTEGEIDRFFPSGEAHVTFPGRYPGIVVPVSKLRRVEAAPPKRRETLAFEATSSSRGGDGDGDAAGDEAFARSIRTLVLGSVDCDRRHPESDESCSKPAGHDSPCSWESTSDADELEQERVAARAVHVELTKVRAELDIMTRERDELQRRVVQLESEVNERSKATLVAGTVTASDQHVARVAFASLVARGLVRLAGIGSAPPEDALAAFFATHREASVFPWAQRYRRAVGVVSDLNALRARAAAVLDEYTDVGGTSGDPADGRVEGAPKAGSLPPLAEMVARLWRNLSQREREILRARFEGTR